MCASVDPGQPWYDEEANHGAIRPWYHLPIDPMVATFYVTCAVTLADDSAWEGYLIVSRASAGSGTSCAYISLQAPRSAFEAVIHGFSRLESPLPRR